MTHHQTYLFSYIVFQFDTSTFCIVSTNISVFSSVQPPFHSCSRLCVSFMFFQHVCLCRRCGGGAGQSRAEQVPQEQKTGVA